MFNHGAPPGLHPPELKGLDPVICDNCAEAGEPGAVHSWEWEIDNRLERIEAKLDAFAGMLEEFRPLLDAAKARLERPRWGGARGNQGR